MKWTNHLLSMFQVIHVVVDTLHLINLLFTIFKIVQCFIVYRHLFDLLNGKESFSRFSDLHVFPVSVRHIDTLICHSVLQVCSWLMSFLDHIPLKYYCISFIHILNLITENVKDKKGSSWRSTEWRPSC